MSKYFKYWNTKNEAKNDGSPEVDGGIIHQIIFETQVTELVEVTNIPISSNLIPNSIIPGIILLLPVRNFVLHYNLPIPISLYVEEWSSTA